MKEVTIVGYCDGDHEGDPVRSVVERTVSIDGSKPVMLDLCGEHDQQIATLLSLMERGAVLPGVTPKKKSAKAVATPGSVQRSTRGGAPFLTSIPFDGPHICPECQFESKTRSALGQHLSSKHSKRFRDYMIAS